MPVTPFHLGPAYLVKVIFTKYFSFRIFLLTQIIIDSESIFFLLNDNYPFHRTLHTFLGSLGVFLFCIYPGVLITVFLSKIWNNWVGKFNFFKIKNINISYKSAVLGALFGSTSHILLDSIMHYDMKPYYPFNKLNQFLNLVGYLELHFFCFICGLIGFIIYLKHKSVYAKKIQNKSN